MMRSVALLCLIIASAIAGPPLSAIPEESLSLLCEIPKCPVTKPIADAPSPTLPYPPDCLQYIVCEESGPRVVACPDDLVFNKNTGRCDTRLNANCVPCWQINPL